jgi:hypothetical protein
MRGLFMGLYTLNKTDSEKGVLEKVNIGSVDYEKDFEDWLENSPDILFEEDEGNTVIWIGRQVNARMDGTNKYPDLMGIDSSGDVVIVELKKGKTPREVVSQALEYVSWASKLKEEELNSYYLDYSKNNKGELFDLKTKFKNVFYPDTEEEINVELNKNQKIFIIAEEVTPIVKQVTTYLRSNLGLEIYCLEYKVFKTEQSKLIVSTERIGSSADVGTKRPSKTNTVGRWNQSIKIKEVIYNRVKKYVNNDFNKSFTPIEIYNELAKEYQNINPNTVRCQLIADCVNHSSRKHYPSGQQDCYFIIEKGKYRLYNRDTDGEWNWEGKKIEEHIIG